MDLSQIYTTVYNIVFSLFETIIYTIFADEKAIRGAPAAAQGVPRLKTSDALDIQNKSLNGSMSEILNVKHCTKGM